MSAAPTAGERLEAQDSGAQPSPRLGALVSSALSLAALAAAPYLTAISGSAVWDDNRLVPSFGVDGAASLSQVLSSPFLDRYYRPFVSLSFYVEHALWGVNLALAHLTNVCLHVLPTLALCWALLKAAGDRRVAFVGALIFALQPAQVAGVAWIGGRTDSLATVAVSLFALCLVSSARTARESPRALWMAGALLSFLAAVFTKEQALPLLLLVPLAYRMSGAAWKEAWLRAAPFAVVAGTYVGLWMKIAPPLSVAGETGLARVEIVGQTALHYAALLVTPTPTTLHALTGSSTAAFGWLSAAAGLAILGASIWLAVWLWKKSPVAAWFLALSVLSTLPVLNLIAGPSLRIAPYKVGPAGLGTAALLAIGAVGLIDRLRAQEKIGWSRAVKVAGGMLVALYAAMSFVTAADWKSEERIDRAVVRYDEPCLFARYNLAVVLENHGQVAEAAAQHETMLNQLFGSPPVWMDPALTVQKLRHDPTIGAEIALNQGMRHPPGQWLSRVYMRLAGLRQAAGRDSEARRLLEIGREMSSFTGATDQILMEK